MNDEKYIEARKSTMRFIAEEAKSKGISLEFIANKSGFDRPNVSRMLSGKYSPSLDNFFKLASAVGIRMEMHAEGSKSSYTTYNVDMPKFLFAPDHENNQLYILHTHYPACIFQVVQTIPHQLKAITLYAEEEDLSGIITEAEEFYRKYVEKMDRN